MKNWSAEREMLAFGSATFVLWALMFVIWRYQEGIGGASGVVFGALPTLLLGWGWRLRKTLMAGPGNVRATWSRFLVAVAAITGLGATAFWASLMASIWSAWASGRITF